LKELDLNEPLYSSDFAYDNGHFGLNSFVPEMQSLSFKNIKVLWGGTWGYGKEKIKGAERNFPDFFGLCPSCQKKFSRETFQNCRRRGGGGGGGGRSDYEKFLLDSIFPTKLTEFPTKLTEFPTKLTEFVPSFIFIISQYCPTVKRILPDWLCLPNKLGGGGCPPPAPHPLPVRPWGGTADLPISLQIRNVIMAALNSRCFVNVF
jgi:hypothetical protein